MRRPLLLPFLLVAALTSSVPFTACSEGPTEPGGTSCCKICKTGKACGDTCIARSQTCRTSGGCACNG